MSKPISKDDSRRIFLSNVSSIVDYWAKQKCESDKDRCHGVAFSIMNVFDGTSGGFPCAADIVLRPHEDDKQFNIENGDDYIVDGMVINDDCCLHELLK